MTELKDLTPRQLAIASALAAGCTTKQIAARLGVGVRMINLNIVALAFLCDADPEGNTHVQIALWYRERVPITLSKAS